MSKNSSHKPKKRTLKNSFMQQIVSVFAKNPHSSYNYKQVGRMLGIGDKAGRRLIDDMLVKLVDDGIIDLVHRGKYKLKEAYITDYTQTKIVEGVVDMKKTGKAYIICKDLDEDVFVGSNNTNHAFNGDKVSVSLFPKRGGRKVEGQIVEILERKKTQFVGVLELSDKYAFVVPDKENMPFDFFIPLDKINKAKNGDKVLVNFDDWPKRSRNPFGAVVKVLGKPGDNNVEMLSIVADNDFALSFSKKVEQEAAKIDNRVGKSEIKKRRDCRDIFTCTIDPHDAKDFDDALSLRKLENGNWEVGIHIADVTHYVTPGSALDDEAYERGTSIYLVDRTIPMLPEKLSNLVCSLRPDEEKLTFSAIFEMDDEAKIHNQWFGRTVTISDRRYTYEEAQAVIEGADDKYRNEIMQLHDLSSRLRAIRFKNGSINFKSEEVKFDLDDKGFPVGAHLKVQKEANWLVEDFMLLANRKVAEHIGMKKSGNKQKSKTFVYRIHDEPNSEKINQFAEFVKKLGYKVSMNSRRSLVQSMNKLFEDIRGKGEERMIETISVRTMAKAVYSTQNIGHYGLAFKYYTHFTSPIRRYPDMMVHRLLQRYLDNEASVDEDQFEEYCEHSSEMERKAATAERESIKYKQIEYMLDKVGQQFTGKISGVSKWGLFVEITEVKSEGLIPLQSMLDDFYYLDEDNYRIVGRRYKNEYALGDAIEVVVERVDMLKRQMDLRVVETEI